ncbi:hypothetical protein [Virgibacillus sp. DJP39]|uniref:hypothetical protein n=1 Tax=Virgibacillus sp. DJP39 TaxID=3409790 RepID=UPI003BB70872
MIVNFFVNDPVRALSIFNVILICTSVVPIYLLLKSYVEVRINLLVTSVIFSMSYMWIMSTEPLSEGAAVAIVWWFLWSLKQARKHPTFISSITPLFLFSILMGTRLSYLPIGIGILLLWIYYRKFFKTNTLYMIFIAQQVGIALLFQLVWIMGLVSSTGGIAAFIELASGFVAGHFTEWGGAVTADSMPIFERLVNLFFYNFLWTGLFSHSVLIAVLYSLFFGLVIYQLKSKRWTTDSFTYWLVVIYSSYFVWVLFAQNIDKPRHILPLTGIFTFILFKELFKGSYLRLVSWLCMLLIILQSIHGSSLIVMKAAEPPAVYQLTDYLTEIDDQLLVFTWEEARVMDYLQVDYQYKEILTFEYFLMELPSNPQVRVFLTDRVVDGFEKQGVAIENNIQKVKKFNSNPLFDPVYGTITLYEWTNHKKK